MRLDAIVRGGGPVGRERARVFVAKAESPRAHDEEASGGNARKKTSNAFGKSDNTRVCGQTSRDARSRVT